MNDLEIIHQFAEQNMLVEKYLLKELTGADLEDFERHLFECQTCFDQVKAGQILAENISGDSPRHRSVAVLAIAALAVAVGVTIGVICWLLAWGKVD